MPPRGHRPDEHAVDRALADVGLSARASVAYTALSGGERQRVAIARALAQLDHGGVLLLDEPRSNLDPAAIEQVEPLIGAAVGRTRVIASHDPAGGLAEADLVLGLRNGAATLLAPAAQVTTEQIGELYR